MKKFFKGAVLYKQNKPLEVINLKFPSNLKKNQILIKLITASICGAQIGEIKGIKGKDNWLPHCMGHEGFGKVVDKHPGVKKVKNGDFVILHWRKGDGKNAETYKYLDKNNNIINSGNVTTFQEYSVVSENRITKANLINHKKIAPLLGCAIPTAWGILLKETNFKIFDSLLIFGAGGIGATLALLANTLGCKKITIVDKFNDKKKLLKKLNINFININNIKNIFSDRFDKVIDTTGSTKVISLAFNKVKKNGFLVLVGQPKKSSILKIYDPLRLFNAPADNIKIITSDGGLFQPEKDMNKIIKLALKNKSKFNSLMTHSVSLHNINKGISLINKGKAIRVGIFF